MPIIATLGVSGNKPCIIETTVSEKLYKKYMENKDHVIFEHSVSARFFKGYLRRKAIHFEETDASIFAISAERKLAIWSQAIILNIEDVRDFLIPVNLYEDFIDEYTDHLKKI